MLDWYVSTEELDLNWVVSSKSNWLDDAKLQGCNSLWA